MKKTFYLVGCTLLMVILMAGVALSAEEIASETAQDILIIGSINDANQLVDNDGQTINVADNEEGKKLLSHTGQKVQVKGTVMESEGKKLITVSAYELIPEKAAH